jgi:thioredoxin 1
MNQRSLAPSVLASIILFYTAFAFSYCKKNIPSSGSIPVFEENLAVAKAENKKLIVLFGASWCPDCRALDSLLVERKIADLILKNFLILKADVGRFDQNLDLNEKLGDPIGKGIPALVIIDPAHPEQILATTRGGEFSSAREMSSAQVYDYLLPFSESKFKP